MLYMWEIDTERERERERERKTTVSDIFTHTYCRYEIEVSQDILNIDRDR